MSVEQGTTTRDGARPMSLAARTVLAFVRGNLILLSTVAVLLVLYTLAGFLLVPYIARSQAEKYVTETLHKNLKLGEVRFNPFKFDASIGGLQLTEQDGAPLVSFRHLYVNAQLASLWQRAVVLKEVALSAPDIQLILARDGSVNLAQLIPASAEPETAEEEPPPRVRIGRLAVTQGRIGIEDRTRPRTFTAAVAPIRFTLNDFKTDVGYSNAYRFAGTTTAGEQLEWSGGFTVQPLGSSGQFRVQGLKLSTIDSYLYESLPFSLASGSALLHGDYTFNLDPFALEVTMPQIAVRDLALRERASKAAPPIKVPELDLQQLTFSLGKRDLGLKRIDVRGAHVDVALEPDGSISLMRLFEENSAPTSETPAAAQGNSTPALSVQGETSNPESSNGPASSNDNASSNDSASSDDWNIHVDTIALEGATVLAEDRSVSPAPRFEITPLAATINGWRSDPKAKLQVDVDATINGKSRLKTGGEVQLEPVNAQLAIELADFGLPVLQPYLATQTAMTLHSGTLSAKGDLSYAATPATAPPLKFTGEVQVNDLRTTDQLVNQDFVKWRSLAVSGISFEQNPDQLVVDRIVARQPYASVIIAQDTSLNVAKVLNPADAAPSPALPRDAAEGEREAKRDNGGKRQEKASAPAPTKPGEGGSEAAPFPVRIRSVQIIDGSANFADYSIEPSFATGILQLNGKVTGLSSSPASRAQVSLQGKVDKYAPVEISGEANILAATKYTALAMNFRNMELTTFNPYSGKFAGYNISRGKLNTELKYRVEDRKLMAEHHIVVDNLEFGDKTESKDAAPIPIKLAVALLKDRNGVIDVNLPVSGTLDDPKFRLGPIIWKAVLGLLTKIVTAPFAALGALFGGGEELAYVDFAPGAADLSQSETEKLAKLAKALVERPQLKLNVPLTVIGEEDGVAIAKAAFAEKFPDANAQAADEAAKRKRVKALEELYKTTIKSPPAYPAEAGEKNEPNLDAKLDYLEQALIAHFKPDQGALDALGQRRARAVQDTLLANTELSPERVFITSEHAGKQAEGGGVRMEMKLE